MGVEHLMPISVRTLCRVDSHVFVYAAAGAVPIPLGWPCTCGLMKYEAPTEPQA